MTEGFAAVPNWMYREQSLSIYAVMVYGALASHQGKGGIYPSRATIAREARCSVRSVAEALNELEGAGVISRTQRKGKTGQASSGYELHPGGDLGPDEVEAPRALTPEVEAPGARGGGTTLRLVPLIEEEPLKKNTRPTRVPQPFTITAEMREWAADAVPLVDVDQVLPEFIDYWAAVPGQRGVKADWPATWRNGMRKQQQFRERDLPKGAIAHLELGQEWMAR